MEKPSFVFVTYINTSAEKLWDALTNPEFTKQYWGGRRIESDWKVGAPVRFVDAKGQSGKPGEILAFEPPKLLSYTWGSTSPSHVTFKLEPYGTIMRLTVTHEGLEPGTPETQMTQQGWFAIMSSLKSLLETGKALTYPWKG